MKVDYIIVGQGLAGSALAIQLLERERKIVVIDQPSKNNSSRIAAGMFNPITGKKMVKTWMADTLFPYLEQFYRSAEQKTGKRFFHPLSLYRPFVSIEEQNEWMGKSADPAYTGYIEKVFAKPSFEGVKDRFGGLMLKQCGFLDTVAYIDAVRRLIRENGTLLTEDLKEDMLAVDGDTVTYGEYCASKIIFCQGIHTNPYFQTLPIQPLKGETISITGRQSLEMIINRGVYMLPQGGNAWRVGATYNFQDREPGTTVEGRSALEDKLHGLIDFPYEVISQEWGMRPTTPDRRPLIGAHHHLRPVITFNGLGTKGVSLAPYFSEVLVHSLENNKPMNREVDIERYKSVYSGSPK